MARLNRLVVAGVAHHVVQRTANGNRAFVDSIDRDRFIEALRRSSVENGVHVHAYVLLDDQVQLLVTPAATEGLSRMMQALARFYVPTFNRRHARTGALWQGRFRAGPVGGSAALLSCMLYVELAPVKAGASQTAVDFHYSSAALHAGRRHDPVLASVPASSGYWSLGNTPFERDAMYSALLDRPMDAAVVASIESSVLRGWPLGPDEFLLRLAAASERRLSVRTRGRPRKTLTA